MTDQLAGRVAVVTGAGSGIGRASALALAGHGAAVVACDLSNNAEETAAPVRAAGGRATVVLGDVTDYADMLRLAKTTSSKFGRADIVVACAGLNDTDSFADGDVRRWLDVINVNFTGVVLTMKALLPLIQQRESALS